MLRIWRLLWLLIAVNIVQTYQEEMSCRYGERGSLTAICTNATPAYFRNTSYNFDHMDETLICNNCNLTHLKEGTFDISGNRLQVIDLKNSHIKFIDRKAFTGLVFLNTLYLTGNSIERFDSEAFFGVRRLELLQLDNALKKPLPNSVFREVSSIRELILKNNNLTELYTKTFEGLIRLEFLDLSNNKLKSLNDSLTELKNLKILILKYNELDVITSWDFSGLENLVSLDLSTNAIALIPSNLMGVTNKLRKLDLSNNLVGSMNFKSGIFDNLSSLEKLNLTNNFIQRIPPRLFYGLFTLRELILSENLIDRFYTGTFSGLPLLRAINISHNQITSAEMTGRILLHQLQLVDFTNNHLQSFDYVRFLRHAPSIRKLYLKGNLLSCDTRERLSTYFQMEDIYYEMEMDNCTPLTPEERQRIFNEEIIGEFLEIERPPPIILAMKVTMLLLIVGLVCGLFYVQFWILNGRRN